MKIDKVVTIYIKIRFDFHKGQQPGMVNAHLPLKLSLFFYPLWDFQNALTCKVLVSYYYKIKDKFCLKISDSYLYRAKNYGCVKKGMLYSDNEKIINTRLTITLILYN